MFLFFYSFFSFSFAHRLPFQGFIVQNVQHGCVGFFFGLCSALFWFYFFEKSVVFLFTGQT